ncbi:hypothetical protein [Brevundimonas sp. SH203]|uniref:hypothetical protein n=1 Tax=Brevundimonas sp. SH203 TaxID=345167 RepID=UPI00135672CB|nr:hypothetical protein [Brevundimonas sp. SH203]
MMIGKLAGLVAVLVGGCGQERPESVSGSSIQEAEWPALPTEAFVSRRIANETDMKEGRAVFTVPMASSRAPLAINIPQYALWTDEKGVRHRVIVVQAERTSTGDVVGLRDASGADVVATLSELQLLGRVEPTGIE